MLTLVVFSIILLGYNPTIFLIFLVASILYVAWVILFLKKRKEVDYKRFQDLSNNQSQLIELLKVLKK